jgi:hypothetical protein
MVGCHLERDVHRDLHVAKSCAAHEVLEIGERAERGMDRRVAAFGGADSPGLPTSPSSASGTLLRPLRFSRPTGWIGGR